MLSGGGGGLGRALADLVLARGGHVFVCDLAPEAVTSAVQAMRVKHKEARVEAVESVKRELTPAEFHQYCKKVGILT